ncbi:MAG: hypothetical protein QM775_01525 [Pirellulales bacterium]
MTLEPKALELLAADRETTVRELRGAVAALELTAKERARREAAGLLFPLRGDEPAPIDVPHVKRFLEAQPTGAAPTLKQIIEQTARYFGLRRRFEEQLAATQRSCRTRYGHLLGPPFDEEEPARNRRLFRRPRSHDRAAQLPQIGNDRRARSGERTALAALNERLNRP